MRARNYVKAFRPLAPRHEQMWFFDAGDTVGAMRAIIAARNVQRRIGAQLSIWRRELTGSGARMPMIGACTCTSEGSDDE